MARSSLGVLFVATVFAAALVVTPGQPVRAQKKSESSEKAPPTEDTGNRIPDPLSATEYFTLAPFIVPLINDGKHQKQFLLVVAIELNDSNDRNELRRLSARMRNEIYELLFKIVSFRTIKPRIPGKEALRTRLAKVIGRVADEELVKSVVVHYAQVTDIR